MPDSVAIEFDSFNNGGDDGNSSNPIGVNINGSPISDPRLNPYGVVTCDFGAGYLRAGCMSNGNVWTVVISYDGTRLDVSVRDGSAAPVLLINDLAIDIAAALGTNTAYAGFTSGTGSGWADRGVLNWQLANDISITGRGGTVPEPASLAPAGAVVV